MEKRVKQHVFDALVGVFDFCFVFLLDYFVQFQKSL